MVFNCTDVNKFDCRLLIETLGPLVLSSRKRKQQKCIICILQQKGTKEEPPQNHMFWGFVWKTIHACEAMSMTHYEYDIDSVQYVWNHCCLTQLSEKYFSFYSFFSSLFSLLLLLMLLLSVCFSVTICKQELWNWVHDDKITFTPTGDLGQILRLLCCHKGKAAGCILFSSNVLVWLTSNLV